MFDVGLSELMLLLAIALVVLGPERLPRLARTLGAYVRKARAAWYQVKFEIDRELQASEMRQTWQESVGDAQQDLAEMNREMRAGLEQTQQAVKQFDRATQQVGAELRQDLTGATESGTTTAAPTDTTQTDTSQAGAGPANAQATAKDTQQ